jgi:hypothetical protein
MPNIGKEIHFFNGKLDTNEEKQKFLYLLRGNVTKYEGIRVSFSVFEFPKWNGSYMDLDISRFNSVCFSKPLM